MPERIFTALVKMQHLLALPVRPVYSHNYDTTNLLLYVNGVQHPSKPLSIDLCSHFGATRAYEILYSSTGIHHDDRAHMITLEMFTKGFHILVSDLTHDRS